MRLRNKNTGEIVDKSLFINYNSLAELNEEWEDYEEEPKTIFFINPGGSIDSITDSEDEELEELTDIGNCFKTYEEAEEAVKKLKAWKRLEDKGFRFSEWEEGTKDYRVIITGIIPKGLLDDEQNNDDLDLLFSGEDD